MAECILMQGGGGINSDDLTAKANNVLSGYTYVGADTDDDIKTGTVYGRIDSYQASGNPSGTFTYTVPADGYYSVHCAAGCIEIAKNSVTYNGGFNSINYQNYSVSFHAFRAMSGYCKAGNVLSFSWSNADSYRYATFSVTRMS